MGSLTDKSLVLSSTKQSLCRTILELCMNISWCRIDLLFPNEQTLQSFANTRDKYEMYVQFLVAKFKYVLEFSLGNLRMVYVDF